MTASRRNGYLRFRFAPTRELRCDVIERPGLSLSPSALNELIADLRTVAAASGTAGELDYGVLSGRKRALDNAVVTMVYDRASGEAIAFNAMTYMDADLHGEVQQVIHLGLVMVRRPAQSRLNLAAVRVHLLSELRPQPVPADLDQQRHSSTRGFRQCLPGLQQRLSQR